MAQIEANDRAQPFYLWISEKRKILSFHPREEYEQKRYWSQSAMQKDIQTLVEEGYWLE